MEKLLALIWLGFMTLLGHGEIQTGAYQHLQIDCGATNETLNEMNINTWRLDEEFIKTGQNILFSMTITPPQMNTLRFFPTGNKNCYQFPLQNDLMHLLRAGFYYGNYDGLSKPPIFDLEFDGTPWVIVNTSMSHEPIFHEMYYTPKREHAEVCLIQRSSKNASEGGVPFISSLEVTVMPDFPGSPMNNMSVYHLQARNRFGSNRQIGGLNAPDADEDRWNRIWKPKSMLGYINLVPIDYSNGTSYELYYPPWSVISYGIQSQDLSSSITMNIDFSSVAPVDAFFVFYFAEVNVRTKPINGYNRRLQIYIDGHDKGVIDIPQSLGNCAVVSVYPVTVVGGSAEVTIAPAEKTTLPALLNAIEVYTVTQVSKAGSVAVSCLLVVLLVLFPLFGNFVPLVKLIENLSFI